VLATVTAGFAGACSGSSSAPTKTTSAGHSRPTASAATHRRSETGPAARPTQQSTAVHSYQRISAKQAKRIEEQLTNQPGVQNVTYYASTRSLQVFFAPSATDADRHQVDSEVHQFSRTPKGKGRADSNLSSEGQAT
jgi:hypothetical protein